MDFPQRKEVNSAFTIYVEEGKRYSICACGLSSDMPFCDGSHKGTGMRSIKIEADQTKEMKICGCTKSKSYPVCDESQGWCK